MAVAKSSEPSLDSVEQRVSYGIALQMGANLARQGLVVDVPAFLAGLQDGQAGKKPRLADSDLRAAFKAAEEKTKAAGAGKAAKQAEAAKAFLEANKAKAGVVTTPSGLQYEVLRAGKGAKPKGAEMGSGLVVVVTMLGCFWLRGQVRWWLWLNHLNLPSIVLNSA